MLSFQLVNEINSAIRKMPRQATTFELSEIAKRQLEALDLLDGLLQGKSSAHDWTERFYSFCGRRKPVGICLCDGTTNDDLLLEELLSSCDEDVLDSLLVKYGENSELGSRIKEYANRFSVEEQTLKKQIQKDFSTDNMGFYGLLKEAILKKYSTPAKYYNELRFSRKLFSKIKNVDYVLSRENALWLVVGLEPDYWQFTRLFNAAGYSLREGNRRDTIIKFVIKNGKYTLSTLNSMLDFFGESCIGTD